MAVGRKTGGRIKGVSKNKRTLALEAAAAEAARKIENLYGDKVFDGDSHALLMAVYKNTDYPMELRLDAAKAAIRFEKPALSAVDSKVEDKRKSYVVRVPYQPKDFEEWKRIYADPIQEAAAEGRPVAVLPVKASSTAEWVAGRSEPVKN